MGLKKKQTNSGSFKKGLIPWNKNPIVLICDTCNKEYVTKKSHADRSSKKFCSYSCSAKYRKGKLNPHYKKGKPKCESCKKELSNYSRKHCRKCYYMFNKGKNNPNYKGGVTPENHRIRTSLEMKLWKKACLERDNFTDAKTGQKGGQLQVHHINNFADFPELRTSISNGVTFSKKSHELFHKMYGRRNNTREQLQEFLNTK